jgi:hypothetical protein
LPLSAPGFAPPQAATLSRELMLALLLLLIAIAAFFAFR